MAAHGDQRYGERPYSVHLDAVVGILLDYGYTDHSVLEAGFLHDVVEDTAKTAHDLLEAGFDEEVVAIVLFCSDVEGPNRKTRKRLTYERMRATVLSWEAAPQGYEDYVPKAIVTKIADRLANMRAAAENDPGLLKMYRKEADAFRAALFTPDLADALWAEFDHLAEGN